MGKINVIFIAGGSYSGSTLMGLILGSQKKIFNAGELCKYKEIKDNKFKIDPKKEVNNICTCGKVYYKCDFWSKVYSEYDKNVDFNPAPGFSKDNAMLLFKLFGLLGISKKEEQVAKEYYNFLLQIKNNLGHEKYIVDDSKSLYNLFLLKNCEKINLKIIYLHREGVSNVNSFKKHGVNFFYGLFSWLVVNILYAVVLKSFGLAYIKINYYDLCNKTEFVFKRINHFLNIELSIKDYIKQVNDTEYHIIAGNPFLNSQNYFKGIFYNKSSHHHLNLVEKMLAIIFTKPVYYFLKK